MKIEGVWCSDGGCPLNMPTADSAVSVGWRVVEDKLFCPLHWYGAQRVAEKGAERERITTARARRNDEVAQKHLSAVNYRAWDQFQSDMADYHKETGKLAPKVLREMTPMAWAQEYGQKGRLDVKATAEYFERAEKTAKGRLIDHLKGI